MHKRVSRTGARLNERNKCFMHEENVAHSLVVSPDVVENACGTNATSGFFSCVVRGFYAWLSCLYATESLNVTLIKSLRISLCVLMRIAVCLFQIIAIQSGTVIGVNGSDKGKEITCFSH